MAYNQSSYPKSSPYFLTQIVDNKYLGVLNYRTIPQNPSDVYMVLTAVYEYRPDLLAFDLYNDPTLWWVFAARNPNRLGSDPYFNFKTGLGIYIPTLNNLRAYLGL
jgi:hypothetical protein